MLRKSIGSFLAGLFVLALVAPAFGAVIPSGVLAKDPPGNPFNAPDAALGAPWQSYVLSLTANGADTIQAVTVNINGALHQRWTDPDGGGAHAATGNSTNKLNGDSHLLGAAGMLFASGPTEDNPGTGSPLSAGNNDTTKYGVGTNLAGTFGPPGAALTAFELAYIVVPSAPTGPLTIAVSALNPTGDVIGTFGCTDFLSAAVCGLVGGVAPTITNFADTSDVLNKVVSTTLTATGDAPITWSDLSGFTYTPGFGALPTAPGLSKQPTWNPATQAFNWDVSGSSRGTYLWNVTATNATGNDQGTITVEVRTVPEPATFAMVGLALVGCVGFARRRS